MSDLHGYLPKPEDVPECDVVCICGDIVPLEYQNDDVASISWFTLEFVPWTDELRCKKVLLVAGNHDFFLEHIMKGPVREDGSWKCRSASEVLKKLLPGNNKGKHKIIYLRDNSVELFGKIFYGTPWCESLSRWAFFGDEEFLEDVWSRIPKKLDVLLTHMPPNLAMCGTVLQGGQYNTGTNYGSNILAKKILERNIHYTFCGHVHSGSHLENYVKVEEESDDLHTPNIVTNVSVKDEDYKVQTIFYTVFEI